MKHGDLSNEVPRRIAVNVEYVAQPPTYKRFTRRRATDWQVYYSVVGSLLRISSKYGVMIELFGVGFDAEEMDRLLGLLDRGPGHPFTHVMAYRELQDFIETLPYRTDLLGVVDTPERGLQYGSRYFSLTGL